MTQNKALEILKTGRNVFLTGEPGSGKTYTINQYVDWLRQKGIMVAITASTGIAATHINGSTIHSWSGLGIKGKITDAELRRISDREYVVKKIKRTSVLIIDEISMLDADRVESIDKIIRVIRGGMYNDLPFGGMQVVFVGDFFQLPPVSKNEKAKFAFDAISWREAEPMVCYLSEQHRQEDMKFLEILTALRRGEVTDSHLKILNKRIKKPEGITTKMYTHNTDVDTYNDGMLKTIDNKEYSYHMESSGIPYLVGVLESSCMSPKHLKIKEGAVVMFTRNNFDAGYVNGTLGEVTGFTQDDRPIVRTRSGDIIEVKKAEWSIEEGTQTLAKVKQMPLRLAWAITVHKSQGMSLDSAHMDLSKTFEYGQGYVALSRVRSLEGLFLHGINDHATLMHPEIVEKDKEFWDMTKEVERIPESEIKAVQEDFLKRKTGM